MCLCVLGEGGEEGLCQNHAGEATDDSGTCAAKIPEWLQKGKGLL